MARSDRTPGSAVSAAGATGAHADLTGVTSDQHHAKSHAHDGADASGTVAHSATTGKTANDHHNQAHTDADHSDGANLKAATATTKGDLYVATASATVARLGVGTNGQALTSDSTATSGQRWTNAYSPGPLDYGWFGWTWDPATNSTGQAPTAGVVNLAKIIPVASGTVGHIYFNLHVLGASLTNCFVGLYDAAGTRLIVSADQSADWMSPNAAGFRSVATTSTTAVTAGSVYYVAMLVGATSGAMQWTRGGSGTFVNAGLSAGNYRAATILTGQTSLPSSLTLASSTLAGQAFLHALAA